MATDATEQALPLGSLWEIPAKTAATITRPDGTEFSVQAFDGKSAGYVLDQAGEHQAEADGKTFKVKAA